jgi:hypothetical protein
LGSPVNSWANNPDRCGSDDDKPTGQLVAVTLEETLEGGDVIGRGGVAKAKEDDATMGTLLSEDKLTEVFIAGHDNPLLRASASEDRIVRRSAGFVENGEDVMSLGAEPPCHNASRAFVNGEPHQVVCKVRGMKVLLSIDLLANR